MRGWWRRERTATPPLARFVFSVFAENMHFPIHGLTKAASLPAFTQAKIFHFFLWRSAPDYPSLINLPLGNLRGGAGFERAPHGCGVFLTALLQPFEWHHVTLSFRDTYWRIPLKLPENRRTLPERPRKNELDWVCRGVGCIPHCVESLAAVAGFCLKTKFIFFRFNFFSLRKSVPTHF